MTRYTTTIQVTVDIYKSRNQWVAIIYHPSGHSYELGWAPTMAELIETLELTKGTVQDGQKIILENAVDTGGGTHPD